MHDVCICPSKWALAVLLQPKKKNLKTVEMDTGLWPHLTLTIPPPLCLLPHHTQRTTTHTHTHTQSLEFPKPSQASFFCPSDQSSPGVERDLTRGRGGGPCCLASRRCGKRQTGSSSDGPAILPRADGALNPRRILKATHDRGGHLFCHHHAHTHTHTLEETHTHTHTHSFLLSPPLPSSLHRYDTFSLLLGSVVCVTRLPRRHSSSIIFLPPSGPVTLINLSHIMETQLISGRLSCTRSFVVMHRRNMLKLRRAWTLCTVYKSKAPHAISAANHNKTKEVSSVGSWESSASSNIAYENPHGAELHWMPISA